MRIIQIIDVRWYNACADFAIKQAQGLSLAGHDVLLLANPGSPPAIKAREAGLNTNEEINFSSALRTLQAARHLRKTAATFDADIILAHRGESHLIAALASRGIKAKVVRFRGDVRPPRGNLFSRWLNLKKTHGIAVSSERLKIDYEKKFGLNGVPLKVIYPALEKAQFIPNASKAALKAKNGLAPDQPVVGIVGRLSPVKGHRYFIEAAKLVSTKYPKAQFVIAGGDAQIKQAELQISAALLRVPNIHFFGLVDNVAELIAAFDIGVIASVGSEMICRVLLEYYAAGLPVVATSVNQISELVLQSDGGLLVPPADSVAMGEAIKKLLEDSALRRKLSQNGAEWVESRSLRALGQETADFLAEVMNA